nr:ATP-binding domain-containing protein [Cohnella lubricantis]
MNEVLAQIRSQLAAIGPRYTGNDVAEQVIDDLRQERKKRLEVSEREPYFGRLDFQEDGHPAPAALYIGKSGVNDESTQKPLVIDWRAPVSSLFYSFSGGNPAVEYISPEGPIQGIVSLKRNLLVRQGSLQRVVDSYTEGQESGEAVADEFLLHRLGESKDNKLRDIVSTIQQEQDAIIRTEKNKALFIQGVAGSGKTTVALHRLAYLLYQYQDKVRADRMMILAPNRMFLDYISGVLPELGVGDIRQTTFAEWALELLGGSVALRSSSDTLARWFERKVTEEEKEESAGRRKGSRRFLARLEEALDLAERHLVPEEPFSPEPGLVLRAEQIRAWLSEEPAGEPIMKRRERLLNRLKRWMEIQLGKARWSDKTIRSRATAKWKAYAEKLPSLSAAEFYAKHFPEEFALPKGKGSSKRKRTIAAPEDLPVLAYIHLRLYGADEAMYDHIVIDEAQDYSPLQLAVLKLRQRAPSMTVLGDLQQGIHDYAGIRRWQELMELFAQSQTAYYELDRSYRSTTEIIEFANKVLAGMDGGVKPAQPVFRSGDPVETVALAGRSRGDAAAETLRQWRGEGGFATIAVLCRTAEASERMHAELREQGIEADLLTADLQAYGGGLTVVPVYLSKGLEFDAVLIPDADESAYGPADAKLLYVGCTRALHRLKLLYEDRLTSLVVV